MSIDHSSSYKGFGLRAISHRGRLNNIISQLDSIDILPAESYCDIGCSNGYITKIIKDRYNFFHCVGLDHDLNNLRSASDRYFDIEFRFVDLNDFKDGGEKFNLVTCFETLEHVGNLKNALANIFDRLKTGGVILITVPIEHGIRGLIKYLVKRLFFRYSLSELAASDYKYFTMLLSGGRISKLRPSAAGFGTHFGFDYRDVDDILKDMNVNYSAFNKGMTRFYKISIESNTKMNRP